MRIALTGADGFTGTYLVDALIARGHEPVALRADICEAAALASEIEEARPDAAIHLAANAFVHQSDFAAFYDVNLVGTLNLLAALAAVREGMTVLLASSAQVYGSGRAGIFDETAALQPANHYAVSKAAMELGAALWADRLNLHIARPFNYTGRGQEARYIIPKIVSHFRRRAGRIELGNIDVKRDFGDVRAVADAYASLIEQPTTGTYNICTGEIWSIREVLAMASEATGHELEVLVNPAFLRSGDPEILGGDSARLRQALPAWRPIPFADTIRWMIEAPGVD